jgi:hypothetical protein
MFKDGRITSHNVFSPSSRRRLGSTGARVNTSVSSPQLTRKSNLTQSTQCSPQKGLKLAKKKKPVPPTEERAVSASPEPKLPFLDEPKQQIQEQYLIKDFSESVFAQVLRYLMTAECSIQPSTVVGITCASEHFDIPELKQACFDQLTNCLSVNSVCGILTQLERYLSYQCAKTMVVRALEFVDANADNVLVSRDFLNLSENMVHLILRRDIEVQEILKVKAALNWAEINIKPNQDFKKLVTPLVKHVRLHLIDASDLMKVLDEDIFNCVVCI